MKIKRIALLPVAALAFVTAFFQLDTASARVETAWGPQDRPTYTWEKPADHVTFNSITDNPFLGDERNFVRIRKVGDSTDVDEIEVRGGEEYEVTIYYHNNAAAALNASGEGISKHTYVRTEFTSYLNAGETGAATAFITASNASPQTVWDMTYMKAVESVYLNFVPNSAIIYNNGTTNNTVLSGDALLGDQGVTIGHWDNMWGMVPGCNEFGGYIVYKIKAEKPDFEVDKKVTISELPDDYKDEIVVLPGDTLNFRINFKNTGSKELTGVTVHDLLPEGITYITGTTWAGSTRHPEGSKSPEALFGDGLGLGAMIVGEEAWVTYQAKVSESSEIFPCGDTVVYNGAYIATYDGQSSDKTKITVRRACDTPTPKELPKTGPGEVAMAVAIVIVIGGGGFYLYRSRKMLKQVAVGADTSKTVDNASATTAGDSISDTNTAEQSTGDIVRDSIQNNKPEDDENH